MCVRVSTCVCMYARARVCHTHIHTHTHTHTHTHRMKELQDREKLLGRSSDVRIARMARGLMYRGALASAGLGLGSMTVTMAGLVSVRFIPVHVCVCVFACVYLRARVCVCVYARERVHVCAHLREHVGAHAHKHTPPHPAHTHT